MADPSPESGPRGGPRTPEGKARSAQNALRHGLRAARFSLLPHEDPEEFRALVAELRARYRPADAIEQELVDAIAVAMWREARADRLEAELLADLPPADETRTCGSDLGKSAGRAGLATLVRYRAAAQLEHRRALALLEAHRRLAASRPVSREEDDEAPAAPEPPRPTVVGLRFEVREKENPLDTPLLRRLGRDPDLVLPVPGVEPRFWPKAQERATTGPFPPDGPQPYRRVPGLPWHMWWDHQHLLADPPAGAEPAPPSRGERARAA
jgi:hypothetical protein